MVTHHDELRSQTKRNTARFFVEHPSVAWVVLVLTLAWGAFGFTKMPRRKDPVILLPTIAVVCPWPGMPATEIEQRITKKLESRLAENSHIERIESTVRTSVSITLIKLTDDINDTERIFDDLKIKLDSINDLPEGAGPIAFLKDFSDTATLMLTVASPEAAVMDLELRAHSLRQTLQQLRSTTTLPQSSATLVFGSPRSFSTTAPHQSMKALSSWLLEAGVATSARTFAQPGCAGVDLQTVVEDAAILDAVRQFANEASRIPELHPEFWAPVVVRDPKDIERALSQVATARYSYRELDQHAESLRRALLASPLVGKVTKTGSLPEAFYLGYSPERLAQYAISLNSVRDALAARSVSLPGGIVEIQGRNVTLAATGAFTNESDLREVVLRPAQRGKPVYLRDLFDVTRDYQDPPRLLNTFTAPDAQDRWHTSHAVTLAVHMRAGAQIASFGAEVDRVLKETQALLPTDLVVARTSDQPRQVGESLDLFTRSLLEAIALVIGVAFLGFRHWRSALLIALSIPLTLAMTFGMMHQLGLDLQQVSIASLILALGLLVDDPVVAADAIQREVAAGHPPRIAAWLGPTQLATAIVYATITNVVAYLPLLFAVSGSVGHFIHSLPIVLTCSLVASRVVSMTFVPLLGRYLLQVPVEKPSTPAFRHFDVAYRRAATWTIVHRKLTLTAVLVLLAASLLLIRGQKPSFFPKDLSYHFYVDVWTAEDASFSTTAAAATRAERIVIDTAKSLSTDLSKPSRESPNVLRSLLTFVGGSGPRFWFSISPELQQLNYAQIVVETTDKHATKTFAALLQKALDARMLDARADVRELETGKPVGIPIAIRFSGPEIAPLRAIAERAKAVLRSIPEATRIRDDWGAETLAIPVAVHANRANSTGMTTQDVILSTLAASNGRRVGTVHQQDRDIPILLRQDPYTHAGIEGLDRLYVFSNNGGARVPLRHVASLGLTLQPEKLRRRNHERTVTVGAFPAEGQLASRVLSKAQPALDELVRNLPPGYHMEIGGEKESQAKGFAQVTHAMLISILLIYLALVCEFRSAAKPLVVFAAIPFGVAGALLSLRATGLPFGFMAFLGIASLIGVVVSHIIVLFDFIEDAREGGMPLKEALLDAGLLRLRPVLITVGATVLGLVPLAFHGGPLWEPLCLAQIGGLTIATLVTLLLVPALYTCFVHDLGLIRWTPGSHDELDSHPRGRSDAKTA